MQSLQTIKQLGVVRWYRVNLGTVYESVYRAYKMRNQTDSLLKYQNSLYWLKTVYTDQGSKISRLSSSYTQ